MILSQKGKGLEEGKERIRNSSFLLISFTTGSLYRYCRRKKRFPPIQVRFIGKLMRGDRFMEEKTGCASGRGLTSFDGCANI